MNTTHEILCREAKVSVERFRLQISGKFSSKQFGERYRVAKGASIEFLDHRQYFVGDDIRFIDWSATARSEQIILKTFQEEISPIVEIILDTSNSMAVSEEKWHKNLQMFFFLLHLAKAEHCKVRAFALGDAIQRLSDFMEEADKEIFALQPKGVGLEVALQTPLMLTNRSIRFVISDFMIGENLNSILSTLFRDCSVGVAVQILDEFELNPTVASGLCLVDSENGNEISLRLTESIIQQYKGRLEVHTNRIHEVLSRYHSALLTTSASATLETSLINMQKQSPILGFR